ncbi:AAA family ATPase [Cellulomonas sp.]|uniref:AAA family ATPase n=1 Tax=Cellulomonas sp. TaxID=40001 RepID=UPI00344B4EBB
MECRPRVVDRELRGALTAAGAVVIEGPKACGRTATARQMAASELRVDTDPRVPLAIAVDPALRLDCTPPQLLDEWQVQPALWNHVGRAVDDRQQTGQFILTGSATPADDAARHSGAGRFARIRCGRCQSSRRATRPAPSPCRHCSTAMRIASRSPTLPCRS